MCYHIADQTNGCQFTYIIFKKKFSMKTAAFLFEFHQNMFPRIQLEISYHRSDNGLASKREQTIIWAINGLN